MKAISSSAAKAVAVLISLALALTMTLAPLPSESKHAFAATDSPHTSSRIHRLSGDSPKSPFSKDALLNVPDGEIPGLGESPSSKERSYSLCLSQPAVNYKKIMKYALKFKGTPYRWGGKFPSTGFDCSGLVTHVYNQVANAGIDGFMTSAEAIYKNYCERVPKSKAKPGDLVFWKGTYGKLNEITHVGIYCGKGICYAAGNPVGYYKVKKIKNRKGKRAKYLFGRLKNQMPYNSPSEIVASYGQQYNLVFDYDFFKGTKAYRLGNYGNDASWSFHEFLSTGMKQGWVASPLLDVQYYKEMNPSLAEKYGDNFASYFKHYMKKGAAKGLPASPVFDWAFYKAKYPEETAVCGEDVLAYHLDFLNVGMHEGRQGSELFIPQNYRAAYGDARAKYGKKYSRYYGHWCTVGRAAGVSGTGTDKVPTARYKKVDYSDVYDYAYYAKKHPDVVEARGADPAKVLEHFVLTGMKAGERGNAAFSVKRYRKYNADLRKLYKKDYRKYFEHYMKTGITQNRRCV